ncbi:MAG: electron transfer flavoprotein subunit alpha/FixB family protein [bacterium]|nr:electron transfer flavoprotein subunit alpha/FixB family protein [bacterium]
MTDSAKTIFIYAQTTRNGDLSPVVKELGCAALELSVKLCGAKICAVLLNKTDKAIQEIVECGYFDVLYCPSRCDFSTFSTSLYSKSLINLIKQENPYIMLLGATTEGRDIAPRVSSALNTGLTADCISLDINEKGLLAATRPTFGGNLMATILCKNLPQMATVRPNVLKIKPVEVYKNTQVVYFNPQIDDLTDEVKLIEFIKREQDKAGSLENAEVIVAGGLGMKSAEGFKLLKKLADKLGGKVGATRPVVERGWIDSSCHIGQTGKTVSPKLYIACGLSGAIQHVVGMNMSDKIIAINKDKDAPIFDVADFGIVGDVFEILPKLIDEI